MYLPPLYRYLNAAGMFAGRTSLATFAVMVALAVWHYASLATGGNGIMPIMVGMVPLLVATAMPGIGLAIGNVINWRLPDSDDEILLAIWLALGQFCGAALALPAIGIALSHALAG